MAQVTMAAKLLLCGMLLLGVRLASAQMPYPLAGQNVPPDGVTTVVVDVLFDNLKSINQLENSWSGVLWFHFMWRDGRALENMRNSTNNWVSKTVAVGGPAVGNDGCTKPCDISQHQTSGCCDTVWLPHIDLPNFMYIDQETIYKYRIWPDPVDPVTGKKSDWVHYMARVTGTFHSPFDFRAWPFEHQHLLVELQVQPSLANKVVLHMNGVSFIQNTPHTKGELVPGWWVAKVSTDIYDTSVCYKRTNVEFATFSKLTDDVGETPNATATPLHVSDWQQLFTGQPPTVQNVNVTENECQQYTGFNGQPWEPEAMAQYTPAILVVDIMVKRAKGYYVLATLIPLLVLTYMVFVIYAMERTDLEARMGVVVTLTLALSALQFTYDFPPANYLNAIQQLTVTAYLIYLIIAVECMITSHLCRMHERRRYLASLSSMAYEAGTTPGTGGGTGRRVLRHDMPSFLADGRVNVELAPGYKEAGRPQPIAEGMHYDDPLDGVTNSQTNILDAMGGSSANNLQLRKPMHLELPDTEAGKVSGGKKSANNSTFKSMGRLLSRKFSVATGKLTQHRRKLSKDEAYAHLFAARLDTIFCWTLFTLYSVVLIVTLYINTAIGDHKLMLHSKPANM